jgi:hypothetical protein
MAMQVASVSTPRAFADVPAVEDPPNVVFLLADDVGYGDLACLGNPYIKTPNLDALHAESVRFTDFHVSPTCAPTRASLMTGRYNNATGVWHTVSGRNLLDPSNVTMAECFKSSGHATGIFGNGTWATTILAGSGTLMPGIAPPNRLDAVPCVIGIGGTIDRGAFIGWMNSGLAARTAALTIAMTSAQPRSSDRHPNFLFIICNDLMFRAFHVLNNPEINSPPSGFDRRRYRTLHRMIRCSRE